ncbi:MAG: hypothetical protein H0T51_18850 [Pirellulales bacterium]|nr:hypothetical protein [Pirellulales bacterium]
MGSANDLETQVAVIVAYLRAELGYDGDAPGSLRRQIEENATMIRTIDQTLRGQGDELGLVGWMMVLRRTWITMVALLGAALGYLMNDVMDAVNAPVASKAVSAPARSHATLWSESTHSGGETPRLARE